MFNTEAVDLLENVKKRLVDVSGGMISPKQARGAKACIEQVNQMLDEYKVCPRDLKKEN